MRLLDYLLGGLALLALPALIWWGIYQSPFSAVNLEAKLETRAKAALASGGVDWAKLHMQGQRAVLAGDAPSADAVLEAAALVRRSSGPGGLVFGGVTQVEKRTGHAAPVSPYVWQAEKTGEGMFVLSGHVPSHAIRQRLVQEARLAGRSAVEDRMVVSTGAPQGNFQGMARLVIGELAQLDHGRAEIRDHRVRLEGETADIEARRRAIAAISGIAAPFHGQPLLGTGTGWQASIEAGAMTLSGPVPTEAARRDLLALARQSFSGDVIDAMELAPDVAGAPIEAVRLALPRFSEFRFGTMNYDALAGTFAFRGEAAPSTLYFLQQDLGHAPLRRRSVLAAEPAMAAAEPLLIAASAGDMPGPAAACEDGLQAALAGGTLAFLPGRAEFSRESAPVLDALASAAASCPPGMRLGLAMTEPDVPASLQAERMAALADYLVLAGIARPHITAIEAEAAGLSGNALKIRVK